MQKSGANSAFLLKILPGSNAQMTNQLVAADPTKIAAD
jgi:hypothetical protein